MDCQKMAVFWWKMEIFGEGFGQLLQKQRLKGGISGSLLKCLFIIQIDDYSISELVIITFIKIRIYYG
jgi:hypothetical protein